MDIAFENLLEVFAYIREKSKNLKTFLDELWQIIQGWFKKGKADEVIKKAKYSPKYGKIFRVQGGDNFPNISKYRFFIKNKKVIIEGDDMVHLTFDDTYRVAIFWTKRGSKAEVFSADIMEDFILKIKRDAVPQKRAKEFPDRADNLNS